MYVHHASTDCKCVVHGDDVACLRGYALQFVAESTSKEFGMQPLGALGPEGTDEHTHITLNKLMAWAAGHAV